MDCTTSNKYLSPEKVLFLAIQTKVGREEITTDELVEFLRKQGVIWTR